MVSTVASLRRALLRDACGDIKVHAVTDHRPLTNRRMNVCKELQDVPAHIRVTLFGAESFVHLEQVFRQEFPPEGRLVVLPRPRRRGSGGRSLTVSTRKRAAFRARKSATTRRSASE